MQNKKNMGIADVYKKNSQANTSNLKTNVDHVLFHKSNNINKNKIPEILAVLIILLIACYVFVGGIKQEILNYNSENTFVILSTIENKDMEKNIVEYGKKHNKGKEIIKYFCREGRIAGAYKINGYWMIPEDAPYPIDIRQQRSSDKPRSGRPKKNRTAPLLDKDQH